LRGAKPAYFQVKQPTKLDLVVNLIVAKALGLLLRDFQVWGQGAV
jgi:hypothetical protein